MLNQKMLFILLLLHGILACASDFRLTEGMIKKALREVDESILSKDIDRLSKTLADKVIIELHLTTPCGIDNNIIGKEQYLNGTLEAWTSDDRYKYQRINSIIFIENNKLKSKSKIHEIFVLNGKTVTLVSNDDVRYEERDGYAVAVSIIATINSNVCI
ncbi:MAG: hypothetical protein ABW139_15175 [Candidatus Thiodiazotropha sp. DIVDIV]